MPANPAHHTATVDEPWDGPAEEAKLASPVTRARGDGMYAWHDASGSDPDGDGYPDAKADSKFPHHQVGADGDPGPANLAGCRAGKGRVPQADIPEADREAVDTHLQAHMDDGMPMMGKGASARVLGPSRRYGHVLRAVYDRPWAIGHREFHLMAELLGTRSIGVLLSREDIASRLAEAAAAHGVREGIAYSAAVDGFTGDRTGGGMAGSVAIIPVYGTIAQRMSLMDDMCGGGGTSVDAIRGDLRDALADPNVSAVVLDVDSPGGSTDGIPELAAEVRSLRGGAKPIVAQVNPLAASAAFWIACQCDEVVVTASGEVGSVGVFAAHEDDSAALDMEGVKVTLISAGPYKTELAPYHALTDDARAYVQGQVDEFYGMFLADVAKGRRVTAGAVAEGYGGGRTLLAKAALAAGMVDRIDTLEATVGRLQPKPAGSRAPAAALHKPAALAASASRPDAGWNKRMKGRVR